MTRNAYRVCLEGNIASGKSTLLEQLAQRGLTVRPEPVESWHPLIDLYYQDPASWSLCFNLKVLHSFQSVPCPTDHPIIVERSPGACRHVFGQLAYNDQRMSPAAWDVFKEYASLLWWEPNAYIYVQTPPDVCHQRLQKSGRACAQDISLEYLNRIDFQYSNFLKFTDRPVHIIDGTLDTETLVETVTELLNTSVL